jgi:hypothetical protein
MLGIQMSSFFLSLIGMGISLHYSPLPKLVQIPYVCLRIPTGGGKTLIGGLAIERANRSLMFTRHSFISPDAYNWEDQSNRRLILPVASHSGLNYILSRHMKFSGRE